MMNCKLRSFLAVPLAAVVFVAACSGDNITKYLELAVDAAIAATPAIETVAGVAPATQQQIATYLNLVEGCLTAAAGAESPTGITAAGAAAVTAACASNLIASPNLPAGTPTEVVAAIAAVANAISTFLQQLPAASVQKVALASGKTAKFKLDTKRMASIKAKLAILDGKLKAATAKK